MNSEGLSFRVNTLSESEIATHLREVSSAFTPPLDEETDISNYAAKIRRYAMTFSLWKKDKLIALIAFYVNNEHQFVYFTHVYIYPQFRRKGYANFLFRKVISTFADCEFQLEVTKNNAAATAFYKQIGFAISEIRENKYLMKLTKHS